MAILTAAQLRAGVQVSSVEVKEKLVVLKVSDNKYVTANSPSYALDLTGTKIGSKQRFTIIDLNGGDLVDGDEVKIRYTPNVGGKPDPSKASYWREVSEGVKRGPEAATFKLKKVGTKYVLQTSNGKFVGSPIEGGFLAVTDKQEDALLVEIVDQ